MSLTQLTFPPHPAAIEVELNPSESSAALLDINPTLLQTCVVSTVEAFQVADTKPVPVGASRFINVNHEVSVLVSLVGLHSGTVYLNFSRPAAFHVCSRMLGEPQVELSSDVLDCVGEIGNIVAGRFKDNLKGTMFEVREISLPAVILGANYNLYHTRGLITASAVFELAEMPIPLMRERFISTSVSLMRR